MNKSEFGLTDFLIIFLVISITIIINSIILLFSRVWFFIIGITMVVSDLISIFPIIKIIPIVGQILLTISQGISNITVGHKIRIYMGFGITLFLYFGLKINLAKLLFG